MKCINVAENLDALLDGEIEAAQKRNIENHLKTCASCQTEFNDLQALSRTLKRNWAVSAPLLLDDKVFAGFKSFHAAKVADKLPKEKIGWFGIPRFALAAALALFTFGIVAAFQIGKMSAGEISLSMPEVRETQSLQQDEKPATVKIVEVPVIKEKIVEVPAVKEKIVTRIIYKNILAENAKKNDLKSGFSSSGKTDNSAVSSRLKDNRYSTQINLKGFQIVSDLKPQIIKGDENEK